VGAGPSPSGYEAREPGHRGFSSLPFPSPFPLLPLSSFELGAFAVAPTTQKAEARGSLESRSLSPGAIGGNPSQ
jgi:hypothetical protein